MESRIGLCSSLLAVAMMVSSLAQAAETTTLVAPADLMLAIRAKDDAATRDAAARLQAIADAGGSHAMYDIGSLYRQSSRKGAAVFAYDPGKALKWLTRAFDSGRLTAAYKVAITYASIDDDMEAIGWAQVYSHYIQPREKSGSQQQLRLALLNDLYARIGRNRESAIDARLMSLLDKHGPDYEASQRRDEPMHPDWIADGDECKVTKPLKGKPEKTRIPEVGLVEYLVAIDTRGQPGDFVALDSAPHAMLERDLRAVVMRLDCKPQAGTRYVFQNVHLQLASSLELDND